jgi:hypothetical protein
MIEKFRNAFQIPEENELIETKSKSRGPMGALESWEHEEKAPEGHLIAKYESWHNTTPNLKTESGFRKYSPSGELITENKDLSL